MNRDILNIVKEANKKGVKLVMNKGSLNLKSTKTIDPELLQKIKDHKVSIIQYLEKYQGVNKIDTLEKITPYDLSDLEKIPLSFSQERLWFLDQLRGTIDYHMPIVLNLKGDVDASILESSLKAIVDRHEVLRTVIYSEDGIGYQRVIPSSDWSLNIKELEVGSSINEEDLDTFLNHPFDLSSDYVFRGCLYDLGENNYVLACVFHHIASDGWSQGIFVSEFTELYNALKSDQYIELPDLALQYTDYALWQREYVDGEVLDNQLSYWEEKLTGITPLELPLDYVRPSVQSTQGNNIEFILSKDLSNTINAFCQEEGVTLFMTLLSAFKVLLSRYTGQEDICVGTPIANRTQSDLEGLIGFFVNTLALRSDLSGDPSFKDVLKVVKQTTLDAYDHQLTPFEKVVDRIVDTRDMSMSPLFQVMFSLQNASEETNTELEGVTMEPYQYKEVTAQCDLILNANELDSGILLNVEYSTALFTEETIQRFITHFQELLLDITKNVTKQVSNLNLLAVQEEKKILQDFNNRTQEYPNDKTVVDLFLEQVEKTPNQIALIFEEEELTYEELDEVSSRLANYLIQNYSIKIEDLIGVKLGRSEKLIVCLLGVLKSGGAYVPIDSNYSEERVGYIQKDCNCKVILDEIILEEFLSNQTQYSVDSPQITTDTSNLAYIMYTSGSTGVPKGVQIEHKSIVSLSKTTDYVTLNTDTIWLSTGSISFDATTIEFWGTLLNGGSLVFTDRYTLLNSAKLKEVINRRKVNTLWMTASWFHQMIEEDISIFENIKFLMAGGDTVLFNYTNKLLEKYPNINLVNGYGPTENTTFSTTYKISPDQKKVIPIGAPLNNRQAYILDKSLSKLQPIGVVGELCVSGDGLARGYLNKEDLTTEKFIPNPFVDGSRIYRTGDLAKWLPDGNIEFIGRLDDQVKIRGYRIELGEIESMLATHSDVKSCCVLTKPDSSGNKRLVAYVVGEEVLETNELEVFLKKNLPEYMVPRLWVTLEEMPLTSNGKTDRKALPEPDISALSTQEYVAPQSEIEKQLAVIWQELLGVEKIGVNDNFFGLGGHSLLVIQLIARLRKLEFEIATKEVFISPTIGGLALKLDNNDEGFQIPENLIPSNCSHITPEITPLIDFDQEALDSIMNTVPGGATNIKDIYPLSPLQKGVFFHNQMSDKESGDPYVLSNLISFTSLELRSQFIEAMQFVVNRHDVLRTCILNQNLPHAVQVVMRDLKVPIEPITLNSSKDVYTELEAIANSGKQWIELSKTPIKLRTYEDKINDKYYLILDQHHIVIDHISVEIIMEEMGIYVSGESDTLDPAPLYRNFIGYTLNQNLINKSEAYFKPRISEIEEPTLPFGLSNVQGDGQNIGESNITLSDDLSRSVRNISHRLQMSPATIFHAAFGLVVGVSSGRKNPVFGTVLSGRFEGHKGFNESVGLFINTLPLILNIDCSVKEYLDQVNDELQGLLAHEQVSLTDVQKWSGLDGGVPLFSGLLNYRHSLSDEDLDEDEDYGIEFSDVKERTNYPLSLSVEDYGKSQNFELVVQVDNQVEASRVICFMEKALQQIVEAIDKNQDKNVSSLSIVPESEANEILYTFNENTIDYPKNRTLIDLFNQQVQNTPNDIAIVYEGVSMTYKELDDKSNSLAQYLLSTQFITIEDLVGVKLERSEWLIIAFFGVLKSGGVYLPIDPEYPEDRIAFIEEDSQCRVIIDELFIETFKLKEVDYPSISPEVNIHVDHLAYIIYTSGSTGIPKGVQIEHKGIVNTICSQIDIFKIGKTSRCTQFANQCFDASIWEILLSILGGGTLYILKEENKTNLDYFVNFINDNEINCAILPPAFFRLLDIDQLKGLDTVITGGEQAPLSQALAFSSKGGTYFNAYGPTETSICATTFNGNFTASIPIGKPVPNTDIYILNDQQELLPKGVVGELCIGGAGLARGYLNREELNKEKFVENPFVKGERIYRTADLAKWLPDGNIEFMGRLDDQVKIRGYRIELGEIENVLLAHQTIKSCSVLAKSDSSGAKRLVSYVVVDGDFDKQKIQEYLHSRLPEYMVPQLWVTLDDMPLTSSGKINKKKLPEPDMSLLSVQEYVAPRNEVEERLVIIWQELLGIDKVGIYDNFFELGGHSLLVVQLMTHLQKYDYHIKVKEVFAHPTIAQLAIQLDNGTSLYQVPDNLIIDGCDYITPEMVALVDLNQEALDHIMSNIEGGASNIQDVYPLAPLQEGIYFHHLMSDKSNGDVYILPDLLSFKSLDQRVQFIEAVNFMVKRHDVLRTCILSEGLPHAVQVVMRNVEVPIEKLSLSGSKKMVDELEELVTSGKHWIELSKAPLIQLKTAENPETGEYYLLMNKHHVILDHVSLEKIAEEITMYLSGKGATLESPVLYRNFIAHTIHQQTTYDSESYFRSRLEHIDEPTLPFGLQDVQGDGRQIQESISMLPDSLSQMIRKTANQLQMPPATIFHAAWGLVIGVCSRRDEVVFGTVLSGRLQGSTGADRSLGLFINTLPMMFDLRCTISKYIDQVNTELLELLSYEQTPLSDVQKWSGVDKRVPLFSGVLNYRHSLGSDDSEIDFGVETLRNQERTNYPFSLAVDDYGEGHGFELAVQVDHKVDANRILSYLEVALQKLIEGVEKQQEINVADLAIVPELEINTLVDTFNTNAIECPKDKSIVDLFEEQALKTPDAVAIVFDNKELTYLELNERANQLAGYLVKRGIKNEDLIGICLNRSFDMIISILGVLKAGGAYVPIAPDYPVDRISYIVENAGINLILSNEDNFSILNEIEELDLVLLDRDQKDIEEQSVEFSNKLSNPEGLIYVIYTSGSTGKPKGVMLEHKSVVNFLYAMQERLGFHEMKTFLSVTTFTFDIFYLELFAPLIQGAKVILVDENSSIDANELKKAIARHKPEFMQGTPSTWQMLMSSDWKNEENVTVLCGGEAIKESLKNKLTSISTAVWNLYGPTEATIWVTAHKLEASQKVSIGKPIGNVSAFILGNNDTIVPMGVVGELCFSGVAIARGYLNKPELTADRFIANPFVEGERLYRTGDLAKWKSDGTIEFLGRKDDQVKVRGYRIELGEIESVLSSHKAIESCSVMARPDSSGDKRLVAYVVASEDPDHKDLETHLKNSLPEYMVPRLWVPLEEMPLTTNGKINKKALPDPDISTLSNKEYVEARNKTEEQLIAIWQELLGIDKIGIYDNFFELGGHSLLATRLVSMITKKFEIDIAIKDVFESDTIEELASYLDFIQFNLDQTKNTENYKITIDI